MQPASYHHGDLRNSLVNIGADMLNTRGIAGISLREIARAIGVGHNAPYRHFRNKHELLEAIAEEGFRKLTAKNTRLELEFSHDPEAQLFESAMHIVLVAAEQPNLFQLMFGGFLQPAESGGALKQAADDAMQSLVRIIKSGQQQQVFVQGDEVKLSFSAMSMIQGIAMMVSTGKLKPLPNTRGWSESPMVLKGTVLQLFDVFLSGLKLDK
jgi:AcrR family transcriptional regulator